MGSIIILLASIIVIKAILKKAKDDGYKKGERDMFDKFMNKLKGDDDQ